MHTSTVWGGVRWLLVAAAIALALPVLTARAQTGSEERTKIYWIFGHPDDETLAAGAAIASSVSAGNENVVIILSSGENTKAKESLSLTRAQVVTSRLLEALDALKAAGVTDARFVATADGKVTVDQVEALVDQIISSNDGVNLAFRGHSPLDDYQGLPCGHPDHCAIGTALVNKWRDGVIEDLRLYRIGHLMGGQLVGDCKPLTPEEQRTKMQMLNAYAYEDPTQSRYGIGMHSVGRAIEQAAFMPECTERLSSLEVESTPAAPVREACEARWSAWRDEMSLRTTCVEAYKQSSGSRHS